MGLFAELHLRPRRIPVEGGKNGKSKKKISIEVLNRVTSARVSGSLRDANAEIGMPSDTTEDSENRDIMYKGTLQSHPVTLVPSPCLNLRALADSFGDQGKERNWLSDHSRTASTTSSGFSSRNRRI